MDESVTRFTGSLVGCHNKKQIFPTATSDTTQPTAIMGMGAALHHLSRCFAFRRNICKFSNIYLLTQVLADDKRNTLKSLTLRDLSIAGVLLLGAFFLRVWNLESQSLWNDEMFSLNVSGSRLWDIQKTLVAHYHHPPLFFYVAHFSLKLFGNFAWALRLPSAIFGALTIPALYYAAKNLFNRFSGITAAMLCTFAPFHLAYSQEGRPYALAGLLCLLSVYWFLSALRDFTTWRALIYILFTTALLYTHHWGIFVVTAELLLIILIILVKRSVQARWFGIILCVGIFYLPEYLALQQQINADSAAGWFWVEHTGINTFYNLGTAFGGTSFKMASASFSLPDWLQICSLIIIVAFILFMLIDILRGSQPRLLRITFITAAIILIPLGISLFKPEVFVWYRYPVIAFPLFCVVAGEFSNARDTKKFKIPIIVLFLLLNVIAVRYYFSWEKGNAKEVARYVEAVTNRNVEFIIRPKEFAPLLNYYYKGAVTQYDETYLDQPLGMIVDTASSFAYISLDVPNGIREYMNGHFDLVAERKFPGEAHMGIVVDVYKQKPDTDE